MVNGPSVALDGLRMRLGILPAVNSGLGSLAKTGQLERLYVHLGHYAEAFSLT